MHDTTKISTRKYLLNEVNNNELLELITDALQPTDSNDFDKKLTDVLMNVSKTYYLAQALGFESRIEFLKDFIYMNLEILYKTRYCQNLKKIQFPKEYLKDFVKNNTEPPQRKKTTNATYYLKAKVKRNKNTPYSLS